ncbi:hypothetical protein HYS50_01110 [Candidatus Woesearchaeota archaeon]|nr:hypothetical protein [Candidatus Woesearchaeota archaeon]
MNLTIKHEKKEPLLHRKEVTAVISHPGTMTPKQVDVKKALADHYKVGEGVVSVSKMQDEYGTTTTVVSATVYDNTDAYKKFAVVAKKPKKKEDTVAAPAQQPTEKK